MSNIGHFLILPNPAHKPNYYAGFPGISPSFPPSIVCIVYLQLLADVPATAVTLTLKTKLKASAACAPSAAATAAAESAVRESLSVPGTPDLDHGSASPSSGPAAKPVRFPLKRRIHHTQYTLWEHGNLVDEAYQDAHQFTVRYVSPSSVYTVRQDVDAVLRAQLEQRAAAGVTSPTFETHEFLEKPSLFPHKQYPDPTRTLARGVHLFYVELPVPDTVPGTLALPMLGVSHTLTCKLYTATPKFPLNLVRRRWVSRTDAPIRLPRYNVLDAYLADSPVRVRNAPESAVGFEVAVPSQAVVAGTILPVTVRLVPDPRFFTQPPASGVDVIGGIPVPTTARTQPPAPRVELALHQTVILRAWRAGSRRPAGDRRITTVLGQTEDVSKLSGDLWCKTIGILIPRTSTFMYTPGRPPSSRSLVPSCHFRIDLSDPRTRGSGTGEGKKPRKLRRRRGDEATITSPTASSLASCDEFGGGGAESEFSDWYGDGESGDDDEDVDLASEWDPETRPRPSIESRVHSILAREPPARAATPASSQTAGSGMFTHLRRAMSSLSLAAAPSAPTPGGATRVLEPRSSFASLRGGSASAGSSPRTPTPRPIYTRTDSVGTGSTGGGLAMSSSSSSGASLRSPPPSAAASPIAIARPASPWSSSIRSPVPAAAPVEVNTLLPPSYRELDMPMPMTCAAETDADLLPMGTEVLEVRVRHELVVFGTVGGGAEKVDVRIPILVNEGDDTTRAEILRYVCA
ncbi:phosphatidylserine decarboxylase 1 [Blastocladiella emersonii ATCC 22665]|nr:phosphatidylserine decarboxylase 1 [Blastocladiella emersonii ATCC 22665]